MIGTRPLANASMKKKGWVRLAKNSPSLVSAYFPVIYTLKVVCLFLFFFVYTEHNFLVWKTNSSGCYHTTGAIAPHCGFSGVSLDGNCAYVHWGSFMSNSSSVRMWRQKQNICYVNIKKWPFRAPKSSQLWRHDSFRLPTPGLEFRDQRDDCL